MANPAIPAVVSIDPSVRPFAQAVKENIETWQGRRGDPLDRVITVRDMVDGGLSNAVVGRNRYRAKGSAGILQPLDRTVVIYDIPPTPKDLATNGTVGTIYLTWTIPVFSNYGYTEIWRADTNDFVKAVKIGQSTSPGYADSLGQGTKRFYWIRFTTSSTPPVVGPFSSGPKQGLEGRTSYDPDYVLNILTIKWVALANIAINDYVAPSPYADTGLWFKCTVAGQTGATEPDWPLTVGDTIVDGGVTWEAVAPNLDQTPFMIGEVAGVPSVVMSTVYIGDATINNAAIVDLSADKITAGELTAVVSLSTTGKFFVGNETFGQTGVQIDGANGGRIHAGSAARYFSFDGSAATVRGTIIAESGSNFSPGADVTKTIIDGGMITTGGLTLEANGYLRSDGKTTYASTVNGLYLGYDAGSYKVNIGNATQSLKWTGSALDIQGNINSSTITGTTITGGVVQTGTTGRRIVISGSAGTLVAVGTVNGTPDVVGVMITGQPNIFVPAFGVFGDDSSTSPGVYGRSGSSYGLTGQSYGDVNSQGFRAGVRGYGLGWASGVEGYSASFHGGTFSISSGGMGQIRLTPAASPDPPVHTAWAGTLYMTSTCAIYINKTGADVWVQWH